ncbi:hypothetical protein ACTMU2_38250 [Cupriavidus basilensis]
MAPQVDVVIVVGSPNSSNSNRLRELAQRLGVPAYMVDAPDQVRSEWVAGKRRIGSDRRGLGARGAGPVHRRAPARAWRRSLLVPCPALKRTWRSAPARPAAPLRRQASPPDLFFGAASCGACSLSSPLPGLARHACADVRTFCSDPSDAFIVTTIMAVILHQLVLR